MGEVFNRIEYKYLFDKESFEKFLTVMKGHVLADKFCNTLENPNFYTISSIYYDTDDNLFFHEKLTKQDFRQKLRLRVYNNANLDSFAFLEIKKNVKGVIDKRRVHLPLREGYNFLEKSFDGIDENIVNDSNRQILKEICFLNEFHKLKPKFLLSYDRLAFRGIEEGDLRITFDNNLRVRFDDLRLENGSYGDLLLPLNIYICEIKVKARVPLWIAQTLSELKCYKQKFSKFYNCMINLQQETAKESG